MVEQLTVIDKQDLLFRVGEINDDTVLMEICNAMSVQFPVLVNHAR
jgi:hypothetical protein